MRKVIIFTSLLILSSQTLFGQLRLLGSKSQIESSIPQFAAKYNLPDSTEAKLLAIFLTHIEQNDSLRVKHFGDDPSPMISRNSPFYIERQALIAKREEDVEKLLGKKMFKNLEQFGYEQSIKRREEALRRHREKVKSSK